MLNLKDKLISDKAQLEALYGELESTQGFAEHCATSILHRLTCRLIRLTKSTDKCIALEAAKCLGVLGPADLTTLILHPQEAQIRESLDKADSLTYKVCQMLAELVVSDDIEIRRVSSDGLYLTLDTPWGMRLNEINSEGAENSEFLKDFLYPFKSLRKAYVARYE